MAGDIQNVCDTVYDETARLYANSVAQLGEAAAGYEILYGPLLLHPEILFLGFQPGGTIEHAVSGLEKGTPLAVPERCVYAYEGWRLARRMRELWPSASLERSTGLNEIFFRAPSVTIWNQLQADLRIKLERFSVERAELLVRAMAPKQIVVLGLGTFRRLAKGQTSTLLLGERGALVVQGSIWGMPAQGIVHLSGARISRNDMEKLRTHFSGAP